MLHRIVLRDPEISQWLTFADPVDVLLAQRPADVLPVMRAVERRVRNEGLYAAGFVTYDAAPAFDDALRVRHRTIGDPFEDLPLAWFGIYRHRTDVEPLRRRESGPSGYGLSAWSASVTEEEYRSAIEEIHEAIGRGDTYQVNHTFRMRASFAGEPTELYRDLIVAQRGEYGAYIDTGRFQVLSASPERFFRLRTHAFEYAWTRLEDNHADTCPLKVAQPLSDEEAIELKEAEAEAAK